MWKVTFSALLYRVNRFSFLVGSRIDPGPHGFPTGAQIPENPGFGNRPGQAMTVGCCIGPGCQIIRRFYESQQDWDVFRSFFEPQEWQHP